MARIWQAIISLVSLLFAKTSLKWSAATALEHVETFAGKMSVTRGEWKDRPCPRDTHPLIAWPNKEGRRAVPMDIAYGDACNILSPMGFCNALYMTMQLKPGSACFSAPVCSTWVYMRHACSGV